MSEGVSSYLIVSHLISSNLISSHLVSSHLYYMKCEGEEGVLTTTRLNICWTTFDAESVFGYVACVVGFLCVSPQSPCDDASVVNVHTRLAGARVFEDG